MEKIVHNGITYTSEDIHRILDLLLQLLEVEE